MRAAALFVSAVLVPQLSLADCGTDAAVAAQQFWEAHSHFYERVDPDVAALTTPRFYAALKRQWSCLAQGQACLSYELWPHPGDKHIAVRPTFHVSFTRPDHVLVLMEYTLDGPGSTGRSDQTVVLTLTPPSSGGCWLVDDLLTHHQDSFRWRFRRPDS